MKDYLCDSFHIVILMLKKIDVPGMKLLPGFITAAQEDELIRAIKGYEWNMDLKRRTQHYGWNYSYSQKNTLTPAQPIPLQFVQVKNKIETRLKQQNLIPQDSAFDALIVNEYEPGQGISAHIDNPILFDQTIVSLSLGSATIMQFQKEEKKLQSLLTRRSLLILQGQSRYEWKHSIPSRKKDYGNARSTRYSLTFRIRKRAQ